MMTRSRTRRLMSETLAEDRLSSLPDGILTNHILSLLSTKQSVSTSVLSTRWKNLFKYVPVLDFDTRERSNREDVRCLNFPEFVNNVLRLHDLPSIRLCRLLVNYVFNENISHSLNSWISNLSCRHPRQVDMDIRHDGTFTPISLLTSSSLVHLTLKGNFEFSNIGTVQLPALKTFNIICCIFQDNDSAKRLFSGCPVLEDLLLTEIRLFNVDAVSINVPSLKRLIIDNLHCRNRIEWELNVPNLENIDIQLNTTKAKFNSVTILKYLRKARIAFVRYFKSGNDDDALSGLVNKFEEVQFLSLCSLFTKSLASDSVPLPMFNKLKSLKLRHFQDGWKLFPKLLERAPCLEILVIDDEGPRFSDDIEEFPINTLLPEGVPLCFSQYLKTVKFCMFEKEEFKYEWLGYLLRNGEVLQKLTVTVPDYEEERCVNLKRQYEMKKKILALPKASKACQIVVRDQTKCQGGGGCNSPDGP